MVTMTPDRSTAQPRGRILAQRAVRRAGCTVGVDGPSSRQTPQARPIDGNIGTWDRDSSSGRHQAAVGVGAFCSMKFCRFSSPQNSGGIVACMELTLARTCASVCAPTISAAATSGAAENWSAAVRRSAVVVARAAGDEAGIERGADHELYVALARHGKDVLERVRMVDQ